jgi:hypothetical protein
MQESEDEDGRVVPRMIAPWLNCAHLHHLISNALDSNPEIASATREMLRKTWVSLVPLRSQMEIQDTETEVYENYSFGIYMGLPKKDQSQIGESLENIDLVADEIPTETKEEKFLANHTRLLLAAGIEEPFSTRNHGFFEYKLFLAFAPRSHWRSYPRSKEHCALRTHLKWLARLWSIRQSPLVLRRYNPLHTNPKCVDENAVRFDAFLTWFRKAVNPKKKNGRNIWIIPESEIKLELDKENPRIRKFLNLCGDWPSVPYREDEVVGLLKNMNIPLQLAEYEIVKGSQCYRNSEDIEYCKRYFVDRVKDTIAKMRNRQKLTDEETPYILVCGSPGSGKTAIVKAVAEKYAGKRGYRPHDVAFLNLRDIKSIVEQAQSEVQRKGKPLILALDEVHYLTELKETAEYLRKVFDRKTDRILYILLTSCFGTGNPDVFFKHLRSVGVPSDFCSRLEKRHVVLPVEKTLDLLLRIAAVAEKALPEKKSFNIEKIALAYLLVIRPWDTMRGIERFDVVFKNCKRRPANLNDFEPDRPEWLSDWRAFGSNKRFNIFREKVLKIYFAL